MFFRLQSTIDGQKVSTREVNWYKLKNRITPTEVHVDVDLQLR